VPQRGRHTLRALSSVACVAGSTTLDGASSARRDLLSGVRSDRSREMLTAARAVRYVAWAVIVPNALIQVTVFLELCACR
jgi:hypothetical protein